MSFAKNDGGVMEYLVAVKNICQTEASGADILESIEQGLSFAHSLFALVVIVIGLSWLKPLKEKESAASFTFWSQLRIRLIKIHSHLMANDMCLYYLYDPLVSRQWDGVLAPKSETFRSLRDAVDETLIFLQGAKDQMPAYPGWTKEYTELLEYLTDIVAYDICESTAKFKYKEMVEFSNLSVLRSNICNLIESICMKIEARQLSIENKLTVAWYKRIGSYLKKRSNNSLQQK